MKRVLTWLAVIGLVACGKSDGSGSSGSSGSKASGLGSIPKGTYKGAYGTIAIKDDGTVDLAIRNCGFQTLSPGFTQTDKPDSGSCNDDKHAGKLTTKGYELGVAMPDGTTYLYAAFVDKAGKLHLGVAGADVLVNPIGADRKGTISTGMFTKVTIGDTCTVADEMKSGEKPATVACHWEDKDGRTLFIFDQADRFDNTKTNHIGLVLMKDEGLLVAPQLLETVFDKT